MNQPQELFVEERQPNDYAQMQRQAMRRLQFWINRSAGQHARQLRDRNATDGARVDSVNGKE